MTYAVALNLAAGVVMLADSRTNAGVDNISTFEKLFTWSAPAGAAGPARAIGLMTAGNLSITQEVLAIVDEDLAAGAQDPNAATIFTAPSMFRVAEIFGDRMVRVQSRRGAQLAAAGVSAGASLLVAGQVGGEATRLFLVYSAGNFIEATADTPFMQIGELKYGKPILDRAVTTATPLQEGVTASLLSMAATLRSNLSVGMPLDIAVLEPQTFQWRRRRIEEDDPVYGDLSARWGDHLRTGFQLMPQLIV